MNYTTKRKTNKLAGVDRTYLQSQTLDTFSVAKAGEIDMLGNGGGYSVVTSWHRLAKYNREVLVVAPCGFEISTASQELSLLTNLEGWQQLQAVRNEKVFLADLELFTQPSPGTLVDEIELLAAPFDPGLFTIPQQLRTKYKNMYQPNFVSA